jgi:beta-mannosidase
MGRFISEFGIHASPALETLKGAMPASELRYGSEALNHRIKDHPKDKVNGMLVSVTGIPDNIQDYVDFTQITQAEGLKFGIEHFRRRMPHCSGTLIWQFNDCWPCVSWSVLDYNGYAKAGFYYVRRAYSPVLASFRQLPGGEGELWITNETQQAVETIATVELGDLLSGEATREEVPVNAAPYSSRAVWKSSAITASPRLYLNVRSDDDAFPENRLFFAPIKDLERHREARPVTKITRRDADTLDVEIAAPQYLYFTHLIYPSGTAKFSDNHFDLRKDQRRTITVREKGIDPAKLVVRSV